MTSQRLLEEVRRFDGLPRDGGEDSHRDGSDVGSGPVAVDVPCLAVTDGLSGLLFGVSVGGVEPQDAEEREQTVQMVFQVLWSFAYWRRASSRT